MPGPVTGADPPDPPDRIGPPVCPPAGAADPTEAPPTEAVPGAPRGVGADVAPVDVVGRTGVVDVGAVVAARSWSTACRMLSRAVSSSTWRSSVSARTIAAWASSARPVRRASRASSSATSTARVDSADWARPGQITWVMGQSALPGCASAAPMVAEPTTTAPIAAATAIAARHDRGRRPPAAPAGSAETVTRRMTGSGSGRAASSVRQSSNKSSSGSSRVRRRVRPAARCGPTADGSVAGRDVHGPSPISSMRSSSASTRSRSTTGASGFPARRPWRLAISSNARRASCGRSADCAASPGPDAGRPGPRRRSGPARWPSPRC